MLSSSQHAKLKTNLRLCIGRLKLLEKKKTELAQKSRKEIADYISEGKVERAKIRVEHIIREDYTVEAMEIVEMYCDTLLARFGMIEQMKTLDEGIEEAVSSLIWVTPRLQSDVKELKVVHDILMIKYGKPFAIAAKENQMKSVNEKLMVKMGVQAPPKILVERYLIEIAKSLNVEYTPDEEILREDEMYRKGGGSSGGGNLVNPSIHPPPPPGLSKPLIDLDIFPTTGQPVMPPPLPTNPPAVEPYPSSSFGPTGTKVNGPIGFNVADSVSNNEMNKESEANFQPVLPTVPPGVASIPPSYDSVIAGRTDKQSVPGDIPDFDESSLPNLPEIPSDDDDIATKKTGGNNDSGGQQPPPSNDDFDFDDLRRRFDELKKKKF